MKQFPNNVTLTPETSQVGPTILKVTQLTKMYQNRTVVNRLNLDVNRGEIFGFLGPNGAGKTTTIRMILGLIAPASGQVQLFGQDMATHKAEVLSRVGALIETPALYLHINARRNLRAFGDVLGGVSEQRIDEVLDLMDLRSRQKDKVRTYSLGMKQRLGIAVALLHDPDLLILDEPTNGLDPMSIIEMREILRDLAASGKTIIISSHILTEVQQMCSRVAIIKHGTLVKEATMTELIQQNDRHEFILRVDRPQEALALLKLQPWGQQAQLESDGTILTGAPENRAADLARFLILSNFVAETIKQREQNLEQIFLDLTSDEPQKAHQE